MPYPELSMIIDGERVFAGPRDTIEVINPATGQPVGHLPVATSEDLDRALAVAAEGFALWRKSTAHERSSVLQGAAKLLLERADEIATIAVIESGKTKREAHIEVMMNARLFEFYAGETFRIYGRVLVRPQEMRSTVVKEPVGAVAAFAPWNFPIANPGRKLGAPIAAGCSVIMKAAEETPASAVAVLQCLLDAGLPKQVAQAVFGVPDTVARHLIASPIIRKVSFTGSTAIGKHLATLAIQDMKRTTMELGGHAPVLVFDDVETDRVLDAVVPHKFRNAGQVCVAPTRFLVQESCFEAFVQGFVQRSEGLKLGDGLDQHTDMGPLAHSRRIAAVDELIKDACSKGAQLLTGGHRVGTTGYFYAPTVLRNVPDSARLMHEEPFGPIAIINSFATELEAVTEANRLQYGLAAYVWTANGERQRRLSSTIESGMVGVNTTMIGGADAPFGGVKWSGHGAEDGPEGVEACLVTKAIHEA